LPLAKIPGANIEILRRGPDDARSPVVSFINDLRGSLHTRATGRDDGRAISRVIATISDSSNVFVLPVPSAARRPWPKPELMKKHVRPEGRDFVSGRFDRAPWPIPIIRDDDRADVLMIMPSMVRTETHLVSQRAHATRSGA